MLTPAVLFALFLVFLGLTWTLSLAESAFSYLSRRDAEDIVREQPGSKVLETVGRLEAGGAGLEESLALWERGEALADRCQAWLDGARARLDQVRGEAAPDAD